MLGLTEQSTGGGELQYLKWINAIGKFSIDGNDNILLDLKGMLCDPASLKTGWGYITKGASPEWVWDDQLGIRGQEPEAKGPEPGDRFKRGFSLDLYIKDVGWRTWTANTKGANICLENIWPHIDQGMKDEKNKGMLAKLAFKGFKDVDPMKIPVFELAGWTGHPDGEAEAVTPTAAPEPQPATPQPEVDSDDKWF